MKSHEKARQRKRRYLERQKIAKYGPGAAGRDMRGQHGNHAKGPNNPRWNAGRILSEHGYAKVRVGRDHPLADPNGYAYEHLIVWLAAGRPAPGTDELIHHINEVKTDNRLSNLELITRSEHAKRHDEHRTRDEQGRFVAILDGRTHDAFPEVPR